MTELDPLIDRQIDGYLVAEKIGSGGMASVYRARDVALDREVVLKVMLPALAEQTPLRRRFQREARATARLSHPHIVPIYTTGETPDKRPYIALQYIEGGSLSDYLHRLSEQGKWISTLYALTIVRQISTALIVAHAADIVHRDLKPSNILLRVDGTAVLSDLGIAALQQASVQLTQTGSIVGTPSYMSPEQARSQSIDGRSDIYSLGIILYELLSGHLPFDADSPWAMIHHHIYERPSPLELIRPDLTEETIRVVDTCLQKDPADRYADAVALETALTAALSAEDDNPQISVVSWQPAAPPAADPPATPPVPSLIQQRPFWLTGMLIVSVILAVIAWLGWQRAQNPIPAIVDARPTETATATPTRPTPTQTSGPPTSTLIPATLTTAPPTAAPPVVTEPAPTATTALALPETPLDFPDGLIAFDCGPDDRRQIYLSSPDGQFQLPLPNQPPNSIVPAFSPDGTQITFRSNAGGSWHIYASKVNGDNLRQITTTEGGNYEAVWSPDGNQLAFVSNRTGTRQIFIMNNDGTAQRQLTFNDAINDDPAWSMSGDIAYESNQDGRFNIYRLPAAGGEPELLVQHGDGSSTPAWSPDGQQLAFESLRDGVYEIWVSTAEGTNLRPVTAADSDSLRPIWSPDGQQIVFFSNAEQADPNLYDIWILTVDSGERQRLTYRGDCINPGWGAPSPLMTYDSFTPQHETVAVATATNIPNATLCALQPGTAVTGGDNLRLWPEPDVTAVTASGSLPPGTEFWIIGGPVWGPILRDEPQSGWWWQVETKTGSDTGWIWQERIQNCVQEN